MTDINDFTLFIPNFRLFARRPSGNFWFDSKLTSDIGPLYAFDDALDQNYHIVSQSLTKPSPDIAEYNSTPEDDPSENTASPLNSRNELRSRMGSDVDGFVCL